MSNYQGYNAELNRFPVVFDLPHSGTVGQRLLPKWLMHYYQRLF